MNDWGVCVCWYDYTESVIWLEVCIFISIIIVIIIVITTIDLTVSMMCC